MRWNTGFYKKENGEIPVKKFLRNLPEKHRAKAYWEIELLKENERTFCLMGRNKKRST